MITGAHHGLPIFNKNVKDKLRAVENNCIRLYMDLPPHSHIGRTHFRKIHWLLISERVESITAFEYWNGIVPSYVDDILQTLLNRYNTTSQKALDTPLRKTNTGHQALSVLGPKRWT